MPIFGSRTVRRTRMSMVIMVLKVMSTRVLTVLSTRVLTVLSTRVLMTHSETKHRDECIRSTRILKLQMKWKLINLHSFHSLSHIFTYLLIHCSDRIMILYPIRSLSRGSGLLFKMGEHRSSFFIGPGDVCPYFHLFLKITRFLHPQQFITFFIWCHHNKRKS